MPPSPAVSTWNPLPDGKSALLGQLTEGLDAPGLWWLSGYAAGLAQRSANVAALTVVHPAETPAIAPLAIVYGSQTGNARRLAETLGQRIEASGQPVRLTRADAYPLRELKSERHLIVVISTQGDGDPPDDARGFVEHLLGKRAPALPELKFAVFGLGDSSYPKFCEIGRRLDARLAELGATRWLARADADLDIESVAAPWIDDAVALVAKSIARPVAPLATVTPLRPAPSQPQQAQSVPSRADPFSAELLANQRITGRGSSKDIRHIEVSLQDSGLSYEPGDALGVWATNPPALVDAVLSTLHLAGDEVVTHEKHSLPLREWLRDKRELTRLSRPFVVAHAARAKDAGLQHLLADDGRNALVERLADWQTIDLLLQHPAAWNAQDLVAALRPLTPRLYSIASSQKAVGDEAHLTVAHVAYERDGDARWGAASHFLASRGEGERLPVFIESNERFRLPRDGARDIVMIGPGTGVAPFRGFVQERAAVGARGRNWLLFGNPHSCSDFLYQLEWQRALKQGHLHRLDLAFSRDGVRIESPHMDMRAFARESHTKTYVQQRVREHGRELHAWLENGAHLYVCGAIAMGKGVHAALLDVLAAHGGKDAETAEEYLRELQQQGRYTRD
ncbi:MAG TPA: flavodoxin domain-containing protein, partial [Xanthomonadaceae bacterium]|nr:flavodoxin domain-containing protein [Xanthomonadaceae bacterium]